MEKPQKFTKADRDGIILGIICLVFAFIVKFFKSL
jgi:hypothetical protein